MLLSLGSIRRDANAAGPPGSAAIRSAVDKSANIHRFVHSWWKVARPRPTRRRHCRRANRSDRVRRRRRRARRRGAGRLRPCRSPRSRPPCEPALGAAATARRLVQRHASARGHRPVGRPGPALRRPAAARRCAPGRTRRPAARRGRWHRRRRLARRRAAHGRDRPRPELRPAAARSRRVAAARRAELHRRGRRRPRSRVDPRHARSGRNRVNGRDRLAPGAVAARRRHPPRARRHRDAPASTRAGRRRHGRGPAAATTAPRLHRR